MVFAPKVSIVIPVYNGSNYLREAIDSALAQTYKNIEIIVVNDGSTDDGATENIAMSYGEKIRYFSKENGGVASALNMGIQGMTGDYFSWLSHDDLFSPNRCEEDVNLLKTNHDIKVVFCNIHDIDADGNLIEKRKRVIDKVNNPSDVLLLTGVGMCTLTIHKSCFEKVGVFNEDNKVTQDVEMTLKLSKDFTFYHNDNAVTYCRKHSKQGTHTLKKQRKKDCILLSDLIEKNFTIEDFFPEFKKSDKIVRSRNLMLLGNVHYYLGAYKIADKYYRKSLDDWKKFISKTGIEYLVGSRVMRIIRIILKHDNSISRIIKGCIRLVKF
jgi:hypothetical protein